MMRVAGISRPFGHRAEHLRTMTMEGTVLTQTRDTTIV